MLEHKTSKEEKQFKEDFQAKQIEEVMENRKETNQETPEPPLPMKPKPKSMQGKVDDIFEFIDDLKEKQPSPKRSVKDILTGKNKPVKNFKLSKKFTAGFRGKTKKNYILVFYVKTNLNLSIHYSPIENNMVWIRETGLYHEITPKYILRYDKHPAVIIPEWCLYPFSPSGHYEDADEKGGLAGPQKVIINAMKMAQLPGKGIGLPGKTLFYIVIGIVVILYLVSQIIEGFGG